MNTSTKPLADLVEALPADLQNEVRDFIEFLLHKRQRPPATHSALDVLAASSGGRAFRSAAEVKVYLDEERDSWER